MTPRSPRSCESQLYRRPSPQSLSTPPPQSPRSPSLRWLHAHDAEELTHALSLVSVAVGGGVIGALAFAGHYLRNSPDVILRKKTNPEPWNQVAQDKNTKVSPRLLGSSGARVTVLT